MQRVKIVDIEVKEGKGEKGDWTKTTVIAEDGSRFSGFDTKLTNLTRGSVIDIEPEIKGKYINIKEWKIISEAPTDGQPIAQSFSQYQASPEKIASIEAMKRADIIMQGWIAGKIKDDDPLVAQMKDWLSTRQVAEQPKAKVEPQASTKNAEKVTEPVKASKAEQADRDSKELFPEGGSKGLSAEEPKGKVPKTQEQLFNWIAKHAGHKNTKFTKSYLINKFKIPESKIDEDILGVYYEVKELMAWPEYDGE